MQGWKSFSPAYDTHSIAAEQQTEKTLILELLVYVNLSCSASVYYLKLIHFVQKEMYNIQMSHAKSKSTTKSIDHTILTCR